MTNVEKNNGFINRISKDIEAFNSQLQFASDGTRLNPVKLNDLQTSNQNEIGQKLNKIADNAKTDGAYDIIGTLYGFNLFVKSEKSDKDGFDLIQNRFFVKGEGEILYNYNHGNLATDPKKAAMNFLNALDTMPKLLERYQSENEKLQKDIPVLKEVIESTWRKEPELKALKDDLVNLEREIQLSLKPIEQTEQHEENKQGTEASKEQIQSKNQGISSTENNSLPNIVQGVKDVMGDRFIVASGDSSASIKTEKREPIRGMRL